MNRTEFLAGVYAIAEAHSGSVTSGLRSTKRNTAVGGHPRSRHLTGFALDVVLDEMTAEAKLALIEDLRRSGFLGIDELDHVHVQPIGPDGRPPSLPV